MTVSWGDRGREQAGDIHSAIAERKKLGVIASLSAAPHYNMHHIS